MFNLNKFIFAIVAMVIMTALSTSEMSAQNFAGTAISVSSSVGFIDHRVMPGESVELIARKYYGVENPGVLLFENPWLHRRMVWRKGAWTYLIHSGEYIRISTGVQQPQIQQPIQILENSFMSTPVFWIGFGILTLMLITLSIIIGILWGGRRNGGGGMQQAPAQAVAHHHTHAYPPMSINVNGHITHEQVGAALAPAAPVGPDAPEGGGSGGGPQNQGARSPVGFKKSEK
jgi:hypothetical protein